MTVQIRQALELKASSTGGAITYWVRGTEDFATAYALFAITRPDNFNDAPFSDYDADEGGEWQFYTFTAKYTKPPLTPPQEKSGNIFISHETSGGTVHISHSFETTGAYCLPCLNSKPNTYIWDFTSRTWVSYADGFLEAGCAEDPPAIPSPKPIRLAGTNPTINANGTLRRSSGTAPKAPYTGGAINITRDGIGGCDIPSAETKIPITIYLDTLSKIQQKALDDIKQTVNSSPILNWPCPDYDAGEVRFEGWTANNQGRENIELRLNFIREPNIYDLTIGGITGIRKLGHEYLWTYCQDLEDTNTHTLMKRPIYCYVERVFEWSDFAIIYQLIQQSNYTQNPTT
jgi:hypothetical protein